jgi:hypothetical protein
MNDEPWQTVALVGAEETRPCQAVVASFFVARIWGGFGQVREMILPASCAWFGRTQTV